jgi:hypothetical protein
MNSVFWEKQSENSKNCSIHSFNNALGFKAITPKQVSDHIESRLKKYAMLMGLKEDDPIIKEYRNRIYTKGTFFTADSVWKAGADLGIIDSPLAVQGFGGDYLDITPEMLKSRLILLGVGHDGAYHAVGVRDGLIFDSLSDKDKPDILNEENLKKNYETVFAAFII